MKRLILTSGPRGSGKSEYVRLIAKHHPEVTVISRDEILIELFGKTSLNPDEGGHEYAYSVMWARLKKHLSHENQTETVILDCWNGWSRGRRDIINQVKSLGADEVTCFYFLISIEVCISWFFQKADSRGYSEHSVRSDYALYYRESQNIQEDGFDKVVEIRSNQLRFPSFPFL